MFDRIEPEVGGDIDGRSTSSPGAVLLAGVRLVGVVADGVPGEHGVELRERGHLLAVVRDFVDDQLVLCGCNQLFNSDFRTGTANWCLYIRAGADNCVLGADLAEEWHPPDIHTAFVQQQGKDASSVAEVVYEDPVAGDSLPVVPRRAYQLSGHFSTHRCTGELILEWKGPMGRTIEISSEKIPSGIPGGVEPTNYRHVLLETTAPGGARSVRVLIRKRATERKEDSYLFFHSLYLAEIRAGYPVMHWSSPRWSCEALALLKNVGARSTKAFDVALPPDLLDQREHEFTVHDELSGAPLAGSPIKLQYRREYRGEVKKLDGAAIVGWAQNAGFLSEAVELVLSVNGRDVAQGMANLPHKRGKCGFRLVLPAHVLNGSPAVFEVRIARTNEPIGRLADIAPSVLTPWDALQRYSHVEHAAHLAPQASYRYRSLVAHLATLAQNASPYAAEQLNNAHAALVRGFHRSRAVLPLRFDPPGKSVVSIVIPVHNAFEVTYNCLAALCVAHNDVPFEVIVVDDGSTDETEDLEEIVDGVTVVRHERPVGFIRACNAGALKAEGEYVVLLNNDTEPTAGWLDELLFVFDNFDDVGLAGAQLLYPDGRLQDAGGIVWGSGDPWNYGRGGNPHEPRFGYTRQVDYVSGAALMISRDLWEEVGGFDEAFCPAYFEDTDLAFKVREAGKKVVYAPLSKVFHFEGMSHGTSVSSGGKRHQEINRPKFKRKWARAFQGNGQIGVDDVDLIKDRGITRRALFIDHQVPRPDNDAGGYAAIQEMRLIQALGFKVTFLPGNLAFLGRYTESLQRMGIEVACAPFWSSVDEFLAARGQEFDLIYITRYKVAEKHLERVRRYAPDAKIMFCNADLHFLRELRDGLRLKDSALVQAAVETRDHELEVMRNVDVTLSYNETEHAVIASHNLDSSRVATCPWVVDVVEEVPPFEDREGIAFLGGFGHPPNEPAVRFFVTEVMPILRKRLPDVPFLIYGSRVPDRLKELASDDVVVKGFVEDVATVYDTCRVFVAPLLSGAGLKGKVAAALAHGTPSVLSPLAAEGTNIRNGLEALIAEEPQDWADAVAGLYGDKAAWDAMSNQARDFARANFSYERGLKLMRKALESVGMFVPSGDPSSLAWRRCEPLSRVR